MLQIEDYNDPNPLLHSPRNKNVSVGTEISYHYLGQPLDHSTCFLSHLVHIRPLWTCGQLVYLFSQETGLGCLQIYELRFSYLV